MGFKGYKEHSRDNWGVEDRQPLNDEIKLGAILRIADACELMARDRQRLIDERDMYKRRYEESQRRLDKANRATAALRGLLQSRKRKAESQEASP